MTFRRLINAMLVAAALSTSACGGDDDKATAPPPSTTTPASPSPTPGSPDQLPPAFVQCMADQGFDVSSSSDIHSAPPDVLQLCFGSLHGDGG
jgi:hypothetical protein